MKIIKLIAVVAVYFMSFNTAMATDSEMFREFREMEKNKGEAGYFVYESHDCTCDHRKAREFEKHFKMKSGAND